MLLQRFIKENKENFKELLEQEPYSIKVLEDEHHLLFKYNQIKSVFSNPMVRECRGLILYKDTFEVACRPFEKFGNFGEGYVPEIDWNSAKVQEKLDGSLIKVWFSKTWGLWMVSTNGTIEAEDANLMMPYKNIENFGDLFWYTVVEEMKVDADNLFQKIFDKTKTYLFELCTPLNRVVVPHTEYKLYYLATKDNKTGEETIDDLPFPRPKEYPLNSLETCIESAKVLPFNDEGYVVVDKDLNRLKVKSPSYVAVHHMRGEGVLSKKRVLSLIRANEHQEYLNYYPEDKDFFDVIEKKYRDFISNIEIEVKDFKEKSFESRKDLAIYINKNYSYPHLFFAIADKKVEKVEDFFLEKNDDKMLDIIGA